MPSGLAPLAAALALLAERPPILLERVEATRCASEGIISVAFVEATLEGAIRTAPAADYRLSIDGATQARAAVASRTFAESTTPLLVAVVLQANLAYRSDLAKISGAVQDFLRALPARARVSLRTYGGDVREVTAQGTGATAADDLAGVQASETAESPLVDAIHAALGTLGGAELGRRVVIVVSDGVDESSDRGAFIGLGNRARALKVPLHPIAYSATDERGPLLNLGEIAKRSSGTFRWARHVDDVQRELTNLSSEIERQLVLDVEVPDRCAAPHTVAVTRATSRSNELATPAMDAPPRAPQIPVWAVAAAAVTLLGVGATFLLWRRLRTRT